MTPPRSPAPLWLLFGSGRKGRKTQGRGISTLGSDTGRRSSSYGSAPPCSSLLSSVSEGRAAHLSRSPLFERAPMTAAKWMQFGLTRAASTSFQELKGLGASAFVSVAGCRVNRDIFRAGTGRSDAGGSTGKAEEEGLPNDAFSLLVNDCVCARMCVCLCQWRGERGRGKGCSDLCERGKTTAPAPAP